MSSSVWQATSRPEALNVMVAPDGRLVLLDFGLVTQLTDHDLQPRQRHMFAALCRTSPEQCPAAHDPASDWYSVGLMLYEALTGKLPFQGTSLRVLYEKRTIEPPPPSEVVGGIPADLNELCVDLLRRDPQLRPTGTQILAQLGGEASSAAGPVAATDAQPFVGREAHLASFAKRLHEVMGGRVSPCLSKADRAWARACSCPAFLMKSRLVEMFLS
jgi:serine/threonine protein kinase